MVRIVVILLLMTHLILCMTSVWNKTLTRDEPAHFAFGKELIQNGSVKELSTQKMPVTALNYLPRLVCEKFGIPGPEGKGGRLMDRSATMICSVMLGFLVFQWSRRLYGARAGLIALCAYTFSPNIIAHARLVTNDLYTAFFTFLAVYLFWLFCGQPTFKRLVPASICMGIALVCKFTVLIVLFALGLTLLFPSVRRELVLKLRKSRRHWLFIPAYLLLILLVINLLYGFSDTCSPLSGYSFESPLFKKIQSILPEIPVPLPGVYLKGLDYSKHINENLTGRGYNYLLGKLSEKGWWYYFIVLGLFKIPLGVSLLLLLAAGTALRHQLFKKSLKRNKSDRAGGAWTSIPHGPFLCLPPASLFIIYSFFSHVQIGFRYMLPALPFLFVYTGRILAQKQGLEPSRAAIWITAIALLSLIASSLSLRSGKSYRYDEGGRQARSAPSTILKFQVRVFHIDDWPPPKLLRQPDNPD